MGVANCIKSEDASIKASFYLNLDLVKPILQQKEFIALTNY